jgi:hypothetical protein
MKTLCSSVVLTCLFMAPLATADAKPVAKPRVGKQAPKPSAPEPPRDAVPENTAAYTTAEQIEAMPMCKVMVVSCAPCYRMVKAEDGTLFRIGSPGNTAALARFVGTLQEGQSYVFPDAFLDYMKKEQK